ncbi:porin family protein [Sedimentitalea todarodis]|uniref:Outer membrane protein beta-barrel domain-containing protein n=1 Tax=Sedimentitalea todarodis TaxID=1631240 RepID=A0ABU3V7Y3_9RHOB|nr:hypothetical protein [Sedimentitalea todarodis]MDU9002283.1 hypothetical protein [Sedimentitalea todarodis]
MKRTATFFAALALLAGQASAQSSDWNYTATLYGWFAGLDTSVDTPRGTINAELSSKDVLEDLDASLMAAFEARRGPWGFVVDGVYSKLSAGKATPFGQSFSEAVVETKLSQVTGLALYRFHSSPTLKFDAGAGFRWFDVDMGVTLTPGSLGVTRTSSIGDSWVDPLLAARVILPINDVWTATALVDFGGTGSDDKTWQALASVQYQFNDNWSAAFGYRTMNLQHDIGGRPNEITLSGPFIAAGFRF